MSVKSFIVSGSHSLIDFFDYDLTQNQECLLFLFTKMRKIIGKTRLQKLFFLLDQEVFDRSLFDYKAYKYGPYSTNLLAAMDELLELGLIREKITEYSNPENFVSEYEITENGIERADQLISKIKPSQMGQIEELVHNYGYKEMNYILEYVYEEYPDFTENSLIRDQVLNI